MIYPDSFEHKTGFDQIRSEVGALCLTAMGSRNAAEMAFVTDFDLVGSRLMATSQMLKIIGSESQFPLTSVDDLSALLSTIRVPGTFLTSQELHRVAAALTVISRLHDYFAHHRNEEGRSEYPELDEAASGLMPLPEITTMIDRLLDRFANVRDNASPALAEIRGKIQSMSGSVNSVMRRIMGRAVAEGLIEPDASPAMRDGRLVLPVAPMNKRKINGIVHDESSSGRTVFIEPAEVVEINNRIRELQIEERREVVRILTAAADRIRPHIPQMEDMSEVLGRIDFIHAKALYARQTNGVLPNLHNGPELEWYHACHPVLLESLRKQNKEIVPLDITLRPDARLLIISGPNAGGKSVTLKTVGTLQYMLQCGMLPPVYENSHFGIFDDIFIDIGDDQSIENDLSTYSSHLRNMKRFIGSGKKTSLILIDEFGAGTEPQIGGALAQAILHRFNDNGMWGVITTHFQNLKHFAEDTDGLVNGSMLYDRQHMQPLFKLSIGNAGSSFAVEIARKTGLPEEIIAEAESIVGSDYIRMDKYLLDIARDRRYWENKRQSIRTKEKKLDQIIENYETDAQTLRLKRREIIEDARAQARKIIDEGNAGIERTIREIRTAQADKERTQAARQRLREERSLLDNAFDDSDAPQELKKAPKPKKKNAPHAQVRQSPEIEVGSAVKLDGEGTAGRVVSIEGKNATVIFGMIKTSVPLTRLRLTLSSPGKSSAGGAASFVTAATSNEMRSRQLSFKPEIDLRGMRVDEGLQAVTYFLDEAIQFAIPRVRILHGTGTGALRQYIRAYLKTVPGVADYHDEDVRFGGAGITVVELK